MEVKPQNGDLGTEELAFSRSLLFLRQLLHGLRSRPRYSSPRSQNSSPPSFNERPLKGDAVNIRYQCFGGASSGKVKTLVIGELSTASELVDLLTHSSLFSKFSLIFSGRKLDLMENPDALIKDLGLGAGLLLVRKAADAHIITSPGSSRSLTAVDKEVLKHFDELYDMLDLKDDLARQVRIIDLRHIFWILTLISTDYGLPGRVPAPGAGRRTCRIHKELRERHVPIGTAFQGLVHLEHAFNVSSRCASCPRREYNHSAEPIHSNKLYRPILDRNSCPTVSKSSLRSLRSTNCVPCLTTTGSRLYSPRKPSSVYIWLFQVCVVLD